MDTNIDISSDLEMPDVLEASIPEWNEWDMVRDDSTLLDMLDTNDLQDFVSTMESQDHNDTFDMSIE